MSFFVFLFPAAFFLWCACILLFHGFAGRQNREQDCYLLMTGDSEDVLEGVLRRIQWRSRWHGRPCQMWWVDEGSEDDTQAILSRWSVRDASLRHWTDGEVRAAASGGSGWIRLDLRQRVAAREST